MPCTAGRGFQRRAGLARNFRNEKVSRGRLAPNFASARLAGRRTPYVATLAEDETGSPHTADAWPLGLPVEDDGGSANITSRQTASPLLLGVLDPNLQAAKIEACDSKVGAVHRRLPAGPSGM